MTPKTILYNEKTGDIVATQTTPGSPSGKWEKMIANGYKPIGTASGMNLSVGPYRVPRRNVNLEFKNNRGIQVGMNVVNKAIKLLKEHDPTLKENRGERGTWGNGDRIVYISTELQLQNLNSLLTEFIQPYDNLYFYSTTVK